jgi:hypothetical protein
MSNQNQTQSQFHNNHIDRYDRETLIKITKQFPKDKTILFLLKIISVIGLDNQKLNNEIEQLKLKLNKKVEKEDIKTIRQRYRQQISILNNKIDELKKDKSILISKYYKIDSIRLKTLILKHNASKDETKDAVLAQILNELGIKL